MKRALLAALLFVGCRTIVGIEDLDTPPPQQQGRQDGGDGNNPGQRETGAPPIQISKANQDKIDACKAKGMDCPKCCKERETGFENLHMIEQPKTPGYACMCGAGVCEGRCAECADERSLGSVPGEPGKPPPCIQCIDEELGRDPPLECMQQICTGNEVCLAALACMRGCKPPGGP